MVDGDRVYPVEYHFLHHSTGPKFKNASDIEVQDWYSNTGKARAYSNGAVNPRHEHPGRPGQLTYAQAQFALREYNLDGNKYGWRLTDLIKNPYANVAWAVGNWWYNQRSCSTEICGNYLNEVLPDKALMLLADYLRGIDSELVAAGYAGGVQVWLHQEVYATACPGRIKEQRDKVVDMINNPAKWNAILWPTETSKEETITQAIPFLKSEQKDNTLPKGETKISVAGVPGELKTTYKITYVNGVETKREKVSEVVTKQPVTQITLVGTYEKPSDDGFNENDRNTLLSIQKALEWLTNAFRAIFKV